MLFLARLPLSVRAAPSWFPDSTTVGFESAYRYRYEKNIPEPLSVFWGSPERSLFTANFLLPLDLEWHRLGLFWVVSVEWVKVSVDRHRDQRPGLCPAAGI